MHGSHHRAPRKRYASPWTRLPPHQMICSNGATYNSTSDSIVISTGGTGADIDVLNTTLPVYCALDLAVTNALNETGTTTTPLAVGRRLPAGKQSQSSWHEHARVLRTSSNDALLRCKRPLVVSPSLPPPALNPPAA